MALSWEPAPISSELLIASVNAVADLPFRLMVSNVVDIMDVHDYLQVTAGDTVLASIPSERAEELGFAETVTRLGRMARRAYESGLAPDVDTEPGCQAAEPA